MILLLNCIPEIRGWSPIQHMIDLAAGLLGAEVVRVGPGAASFANRALALLSGRRRGAGGRDFGLLICAGPSDLRKAFGISNWRSRFGFLSAWVIDSFWVDHIPTSVTRAQPFDHIFVTSLEDIEQWKSQLGVPVSWLPWGSDVLNLGAWSGQRPWDVTRVGRQPKEWDDDSISSAAAAEAGLKFRGRPPSDGLNVLENHKYLMRVYSASKYLLAFSNLANREAWTHPVRDYVTGRWVDALACGSVVAGIPPRGLSATELLWPEATLDLKTVERKEGLRILADAISGWTEAVPYHNYSMALQKLDWRWRFEHIARTFGIAPAPLVEELARLRGQVQIMSA